jgi:tetratricopeptide (TPR) repeat protein
VPDLPDRAVDRDRLRQVRALFDAAMDKAPQERRALIDENAGSDAALRDEVLALLADEEAAKGFLSGSAVVPQSLAPTGSAEVRPSLAGRQIGPYRLLDEIGHGGMGTVHRAARTDDAFQRTVALKLVRAAASSDFIQQRFLRERQILGRLQHPNIATVFDGGTTDDGQPYLVMEYVEGEPIDRYCAARELSTRHRLEMFRQVCAAVHYAHQNLVVHRDLKPGNILVTVDGTPKLLDFGIAKLLAAGVDPEAAPTATMLPMMTPEYASPEQVRGETITTASDVYSLGVVLYELLTGRRPYVVRTESLEEIVRAVCGTEPAPPSVALRTGSVGATPTPVTVGDLRGDVDTITLKALRKEPVRRYPSAQELSEDIRRYLKGLPVTARGESKTYRIAKFVGRHRLGAGAALLLAASLVGGIVVSVREARIAEEQRRRAERRFDDVRKLARTLMFDVHDGIAALPGSTATRKLLVTEALTYLDSLAGETGGDPSLLMELATGYQKMGDVLGWPNTPNLGDVPGALKAYAKAQEMRQRLLANDPANVEVLREVSATAQRMSRAWDFARNPATGVAEARKAASIEERLSTSDRSPAQTLRLGRAYANHGFLLYKAGRSVESIARQREALAILEPLYRANPSDTEVTSRLAVTWGYLAAVLRSGESVAGVVPDLKAALEAQNSEVALEESLLSAAKGAPDTRLQRQLWIGRTNLGEILEDLGDRRGAGGQFRTGLARVEQLARADAANLQAQKDLAYACVCLGRILVKDGVIDEAFVLLERADKLIGPALAADPVNINTAAVAADIKEWLAHAHVVLASHPRLARHARLGHWREARARFQSARKFWTELRDKGDVLIETRNRTNPETLAAEIAKCDAALAASARPAGTSR